MRRKGFTFVELAIVLVIIGIIMGMLIKGRSLVEVARLKSEVRKIERIQTGVAGWFSKTSGGIEAMDAFPLINDGDPTKLNYRALTDISEADITHPYGQWELYRGKLVGDNTSATITEAGINVILHTDNITPRFACNIEFMIDDRQFKKGNCRSEITEVLTTGLEPEFRPCDDWAEIIEASTLDYRIF
jgi:prepilin-type N-terminal cleavage/methylation domain-containing protein